MLKQINVHYVDLNYQFILYHYLLLTILYLLQAIQNLNVQSI